MSCSEKILLMEASASADGSTEYTQCNQSSPVGLQPMNSQERRPSPSDLCFPQKQIPFQLPLGVFFYI